MMMKSIILEYIKEYKSKLIGTWNEVYLIIKNIQPKINRIGILIRLLIDAVDYR